MPSLVSGPYASYGTPPPGDDRPDPTSSPEQPAEGYGSPPPPPPQYGEAQPPPAAPQPGYGQAPPPPPATGGYAAPPPADAGYAPPPPPPAYGGQGYGAAPAYTGPYEQGASVGTLALWPQRALGWVIDFIALAIPGYILYWLGAPKTTIVGNSIVQSGPGFLYYLGGVYILALWIYLLGLGLAPARVLTVAKGENAQLAPTEQGVRLRTNRAVGVVIQDMRPQ